MKLIDVHAHLESSRFSKDLDEVVERFKEAGGKFIINSGVNPLTNRKALKLSEKYDVVKASFGLFPIDCIASELKLTSEESDLREIEIFDLDSELAWIEEHRADCVAIGEVGLDYAESEVKERDDLKELEKDNFRKIIDLAKKIDKPLIVHTRKGEADSIHVLEEESAKKVVLHCFHGNKKLIKRGVENGWNFSIPTNITRLEHFQMMVGMIPLEQLLTETDAPYLSPVVSMRNESANVAVTIKKIAEIKGISEDEVANKIFKNAESLFGI